jgi:hypothetical protein
MKYAENQMIFSITDYNILINSYVVRNFRRTVFPHVENHFPLSILYRDVKSYIAK